MTIQLIDTVTPDVGLKTVADKLNANFTNADHAASKLVGTASGEIPTNADLPTFGTAATADTGLATGNVPTADQLSMVGETVNYTGANYQPEITQGLGVVRIMRNLSGGTVSELGSVAGSSLQFVKWSGAFAVVPTGVVGLGTWKNVSSVGVGSTEYGMFVRIA